jgi:ribonuclease P protein component
VGLLTVAPGSSSHPDPPAAVQPAVERLSGRDAFERLRREGRRANHGAVGLTWVPDPRSLRVAYAVGRGVGSAVVRNRVRRRLRAVMASLAVELPLGDWLVGARPSAATCSSEELRHDVVEALARLDPACVDESAR